ncbi:MAG: hypothetical protein KGH64_04375 [Candidatus Micrarchaeota archaeon]|nr:hypothetical protein [Candidatus Micrarchaeota archaeon]MDE1834548.1 hypothetical protein [Candidatus Micrarchaeota archaeon]MDE1859784.1 hypothetical protein [Candidatus Micrarchaeota archaeon]
MQRILPTKQPRYAFERQEKTSSSYDCTDQLGKIGVPTFILHGKKDNISQYVLAEELRLGIKYSKLFTSEGDHDFFMVKQKNEFLETLSSIPDME